MEKNRLDTLKDAGIPIWITELDVDEKDPEKRADNLEGVMRVAFSHEAVEGLVLWSLWSQADKSDTYLLDGKDVPRVGAYACITSMKRL